MLRSGGGRRREPRGTDVRSTTRAERRAAIARRRGTAALVAAVVASAVILVAWFPAGALIAQRRTLASTSAELRQLRSEDAALRKESANLSNPAEIARIARQQFQLIEPGEQAYQILPPPGKAAADTDPYSGDPADAPLVSPSGAAELPPGTVAAPSTSGTDTKASARKDDASAAPDLFTRVLHTLEFWR